MKSGYMINADKIAITNKDVLDYLAREQEKIEDRDGESGEELKKDGGKKEPIKGKFGRVKKRKNQKTITRSKIIKKTVFTENLIIRKITKDSVNRTKNKE
ncbi:hypothetical protein GWI33_003679 [Rhynchophorus ferrugineus]|uniref:Uncharacterized protein n=1 Tax=Rhynchophorus ferrugineus TaxID=354439 RepID=A0A834INP6_RHYFE|nr:hypothetical protein GWI33_003679 [Rhynchophorus ferrugineus]